MNPFLETITADDPALRDRSFRAIAEGMAPEAILRACDELEAFRRATGNLYHRVRATLFLYAAYRFALRGREGIPETGSIPPQGAADLMERRFEQAVQCFRGEVRRSGPSGALFSALAEAYHHLAFQTLLDQVRRSVRASRGNQWMFRVGHARRPPRAAGARDCSPAPKDRCSIRSLPRQRRCAST